jgi:hypothetical protein
MMFSFSKFIMVHPKFIFKKLTTNVIYGKKIYSLNIFHYLRIRLKKKININERKIHYIGKRFLCVLNLTKLALEIELLFLIIRRD